MYFDNDYVRVLTVHAHAQLLRLIAEHQSSKHVVVHLSCTTCAACRALEAEIAALSLKYPVNAVFLRANIAMLSETAVWAGLPKEGDLDGVRAPMVRVFPSSGDAAAIEFEGTHGGSDATADLAVDDIERVLLDLGAISYLDTHLHAFPPRATTTGTATAADVEGADDTETHFHHLADTAPAAVSEFALATPAPASPEPSTMDLRATITPSPPPHVDQQPIDIDALMSIGATGTVPPATPPPVVCARHVSTDVADLLEYVDKLERIRKATLEDDENDRKEVVSSPARRPPLTAAATGAKGAVAAAAVAVTAALVWTQMRAASVVAMP
ncbi:hypothetical protein GGF31_008686 [Allomyces arbusculus]|nr:hypothetical protein GGF31_008686 [Allomyces arbusculus]